jgi:hypothetical protein
MFKNKNKLIVLALESARTQRNKTNFINRTKQQKIRKIFELMATFELTTTKKFSLWK